MSTISSKASYPTLINFHPDNKHYYPNSTPLDREVLKNLKRRPVTLQEIKKNYRPVYNNTFGKVRLNPNMRDFFKTNSQITNIDEFQVAAGHSSVQIMKDLKRNRPQSAQVILTSSKYQNDAAY